MYANMREGKKMITIDYLKHHPQHIPTLTEIWLDVIGKKWTPHVTFEEAKQRFQTRLNADTLPLTLVALDENIPVGMCSLCFIDGIRNDLSPWLGSLVVDPQRQNKGIGKMLINSTKDKAKIMGYKTLYLFTFDPTLPSYYNQLGWNTLERGNFQNRPITIMSVNL